MQNLHPADRLADVRSEIKRRRRRSYGATCSNTRITGPGRSRSRSSARNPVSGSTWKLWPMRSASR